MLANAITEIKVTLVNTTAPPKCQLNVLDKAKQERVFPGLNT